MTFYYLLLSQQELLENQGFEEILRERSTYFFQQKKARNFWLVLSPSFLNDPFFSQKFQLTQFFQSTKGLSFSKEKKETKFFVALISLDKDFINWVGLRLGYFEKINEEQRAYPFVSTGIKGEVNKEANKPNLLQGQEPQVDFNLLLEKEKFYFNFFVSSALQKKQKN